MSDKEGLLKTLDDLADEEFKKFKLFLQQPEILGTSQAIPKNQLENADRLDTVDKIIQTFSHQSVEVVKEVLKKINRNDLVEKLSSINTGEQGKILLHLSINRAGYWIQPFLGTDRKKERSGDNIEVTVLYYIVLRFSP
uniref:Pyrin domain-containing protein n=1 Tax=Sander lucioperca TaxID=283035 RepID=A0A8C9XEM9_SANLU